MWDLVPDREWWLVLKDFTYTNTRRKTTSDLSHVQGVGERQVGSTTETCSNCHHDASDICSVNKRCKASPLDPNSTTKPIWRGQSRQQWLTPLRKSSIWSIRSLQAIPKTRPSPSIFVDLEACSWRSGFQNSWWHLADT